MIGGIIFSSLSIPGSKENNNTSIQCRTIRTVPTVSINSSNQIFWNIQGFLGPPPNLMISQADENCTRILSWAALDLTNTELNILYYLVCYHPIGDLKCVNVSSSEKREFRFSDVYTNIVFTVTAVNVVGVGNASSILNFYQPREYNNAEGKCQDGGNFHGRPECCTFPRLPCST